MAKIRLTGATFDASAQTVVHASFSDIGLAGIQMIINVTDQIIIYNFADTAKGGTLATDTLTLEHDTTSMSDTDELMILVEDGVATQSITVSNLPLPTGASTSANQTTIIGHLDGVEGLLTTIDADTGSILTAVDGIESLLGTIDADTGNISTKIDTIAASVASIDTDTTTIIGHVDGIETAIGTTNTTLTTIDGRVDGIETLLTTIDGRVDGLEASNSGIQTAVELIDDTVKVLGTDTYTEATSKGVVIGAVRRDADTTMVNTTNEFGPLQMDANGRLKVEVFSGETLPVSGTVTETNSGAIASSLSVLDNRDNGASDGASVSGDVAHDTADAGEPVKIGMKAYELDGTAPQTAVAEGDRVNAIGDLVGRQYVATEHPRFWHVSADYASAQTNTSLKTAPGAGVALYITDIMLSNGATAGNITLLAGSGGTVLFEIYPAVNGGVALNLKNPIKLTDNTALCITSTTVTTHSIFISGFID